MNRKSSRSDASLEGKSTQRHFGSFEVTEVALPDDQLEAPKNYVDLGIDSLVNAELIGEGGFANVYSATERGLERRVAVKVMRQNLTPSAQRSFARESAAMGRLSTHPNVASVHSAGYTDGGQPYLIMELFTGGSLSSKVKDEGTLDWREALRYIIPVADALDAAHTAGILHRDVKPDNILLSDDQPHLTDFGMAEFQEIGNNTTSEVVASWHHSPPETLDDERDERSDIYSAASTLYTLIAGQAPFAGSKSFLSLVHQVTTQPPPLLPPDRCPPEFNDFFRRAMAKDPDRRPQTAADFGDELRRLATLNNPGDRRSPQQWFSANGRRVIGLVGALAVVAVVVLATSFLGNGDDVTNADAAADSDPSAATIEQAAGLGSRQEPYPLGQSVNLSYADPATGETRRWQLQVVEALVELPGATEQSDAEQLVGLRLRVTHLEGPDPGPLDEFLLFTATESEPLVGLEVEACPEENAPLPIDGIDGVPVTGSTEGWLCWLAPTDSLDSTTLAVAAKPADGHVYLALR